MTGWIAAVSLALIAVCMVWIRVETEIQRAHARRRRAQEKLEQREHMAQAARDIRALLESEDVTLDDLVRVHRSNQGFLGAVFGHNDHERDEEAIRRCLYAQATELEARSKPPAHAPAPQRVTSWLRSGW